MVSEGMERVIKLLQQQGEIATKKRVEDGRNGLEQLGAMEKVPDDVKIEEVDAGGVPAVWIVTPDIVKESVVLYLHGGVYVEGSINSI